MVKVITEVMVASLLAAVAEGVPVTEVLVATGEEVEPVELTDAVDVVPVAVALSAAELEAVSGQ